MKKFLSLILAALLVLSATVALADTITIAVPNDPTNEGRALLLLQANGYIKLDGIDGGNGPDYKWTWYDGTCALTSTGVGGTGSAPEISGLAVREREADCTTLGSVLLESKAFTVEVADYKGCWLKKDFTVR